MRYIIFAIVSVIFAFVCGCEVSEVDNIYIGAFGANNEEVTNSNIVENSTDEEDFLPVDYGGGGVATNFKVPLDPEYDWEVTQSWASHCKDCTKKGYGKGQADPNMCNWTHATLSSCKYGLDFNLPGENDNGKFVLATGEGTVKKAGWCGTWGNCVVIDHGNNVCSRYAHMQDNSVTVKKGDGVCQGLILGKIGNTGSSEGSHLHFQFENCKAEISISKFFTDGNAAPKCVVGKDIYTSTGKYSALVLTNKPKEACDLLGEFAKKKFNHGATLPVPGIKSVSCGSLPNCPLITSCNAEKDHLFSDDKYLNSSVREAAQYLYGECAINGKDDGGLHQSDIITIAEGLKISMYLFEQVSDCGNNSAYVPFSDVKTTDWFYPLVICGLQKDVLDNSSLLFWANASLSFEMAAKFLVRSAVNAGVIELKNPSTGSFDKIPYDHPAYKYVETLYAYAAIDTNFTSYYPETSITRGQFVRMAANLSPCYCNNISCDGACTCDQVNFACSNSDSGSDVGGGGSGGSSSGSSGGSGSGASDSCGGCPSGFFCNSKNLCQCMAKCPATGCGSDGCGGFCECSSGYSCSSGYCVKTCVPQCSGKDCGANGCGGICGNCDYGSSCNASGQCIANPDAPPCKPIDCTGILCGSDGCGGICDNCKNGAKCRAIKINAPQKYLYYCASPSK